MTTEHRNYEAATIVLVECARPEAIPTTFQGSTLQEHFETIKTFGQNLPPMFLNPPQLQQPLPKSQNQVSGDLSLSLSLSRQRHVTKEKKPGVMLQKSGVFNPNLSLLHPKWLFAVSKQPVC